MKLRRIAVLVSKDFFYGPKNLVFIFAVVVPVILSLVISLLAGSLFADLPRLGVVDLGQTELVDNLAELDYLILHRYETSAELREDVARGRLDMGLVLPIDLEVKLQEGRAPTLNFLTWGESLLRHRTQLGAALVTQIIDLAGHDLPVETQVILLGDQESIPWDIRLFPLVVIITITLGGMMVPATFIVDEKQKRTIKALLVTPVSLEELLVAKGISGVLISMIMGAIILTINQAWGVEPLLLGLVLILSSILVVMWGIIMGLLVSDITNLFTAWKTIGILLFAPAFLFMFPQIPEWVSRVFPTYYMLGPIVDISLQNARFGDVAGDLIVLGVLILITLLATRLVARRFKTRRN